MRLAAMCAWLPFSCGFAIKECESQSCRTTNASFALDSNYTSGYTIGDDSITLYNSKSPRLYLTKKLSVLGKQLRFDVDISTLPCGSNSALYLIDVPAGIDYCDAQGQLGSLCNEMDVFEGNSIANAFTSHSCSDAACDKDGCGINTKTSELSIDVSKPFTVITEFVETNGALSSINRRYEQSGVFTEGGTLYSCGTHGGFATMTESLSSEMVVAISIWGGAYDMSWLDDCPTSSYDHTAIASAHTTFSNIIIGTIGEDYSTSTLTTSLVNATSPIKLSCTLA